MAQKRYLMGVLVSMIVLVWAAALNGAGLKPITPKEAYDLVRKNAGNPDFVILDVRTPDEYDEGHIEGAINIDFNSGGFKTELSELDKKKTYLVYCRTSRRSGEAAKIMKDLGFTNIIRMKGDIVKWQSAGLPLVK